MIPLRDSNPSRRVPLVTLLVIAANVLIFFYEITLGPAQLNQFVFTFGVVPARLTGAARRRWSRCSSDCIGRNCRQSSPGRERR